MDHTTQDQRKYVRNGSWTGPPRKTKALPLELFSPEAGPSRTRAHKIGGMEAGWRGASFGFPFRFSVFGFRFSVFDFRVSDFRCRFNAHLLEFQVLVQRTSSRIPSISLTQIFSDFRYRFNAHLAVEMSVARTSCCSGVGFTHIFLFRCRFNAHLAVQVSV